MRRPSKPQTPPVVYVPPKLIPYHLRRSLRQVTLSWAFGSTWLYITTGAALTRYAKLLGVPEYGFGVLAAIPFLGALAQLPSSYYMEHYGHRKGLFIAAGLLHRFLWLVVAAIPWIAPTAWWWPALAVMMAASSLLGHVATPGVLGWFADLVPRQLRGRYFSRRMQVGQLVGLVVTVAIGLVLDRSAGMGSQALRVTISLGLAVAALCGIADFLVLAFVPNPPSKGPDAGARFWSLLREPLRDRNFRCYVGYNATLTFSMGFVGQYIWLYVFDVAKMSNSQANLMLVGIPLLVAMICAPFWGRVVDRLGRRPVLLIAGALIVPGAAAWTLVTAENWWLGYLIVLVAVFAWPGIELANFNVLLGLTSSDSAGRHGSAYIAMNSIAVAVAGTLSGLFGGAVAAAFHNWQGSFLGWPVTYHGLLFLCSAALRLLALLWALRLRDPGATATREALRAMATNIYSNMHQAIFMPARRIVSRRRQNYWMRRARERDGRDRQR